MSFLYGPGAHFPIYKVGFTWYLLCLVGISLAGDLYPVLSVGLTLGNVTT